mgnify:CR=1 FL=1
MWVMVFFDLPTDTKKLYLIVLHKSYCVQRTNIQNLKAIHNDYGYAGGGSAIVFKERIYKI